MVHPVIGNSAFQWHLTSCTIGQPSSVEPTPLACVPVYASHAAVDIQCIFKGITHKMLESPSIHEVQF